MDKKSIFFGIALLTGGMALMFYNFTQQQKAAAEQARQQQQAAEQAAAADPAQQQSDPAATGGESTPLVANPSFEPSGDGMSIGKRVDTTVAEAAAEAEGSVVDLEREELFTLENNVLRVVFTTHGGGIKRIELKDYNAVQGESAPVILNALADEPALGITQKTTAGYTTFAPYFEMEQLRGNSISFAVSLPSGVMLRRVYELSESVDGASAYTIRHTTEFVNQGETGFSINNIFLNVGTAAPTDADRMGFNLNASYLDEGDYGSIPASKFRGGGILFFKSEPKELVERRGQIQWGAVKNQFFVSIVTPDEPAQALVAQGVPFPALSGLNQEPMGVIARMEFDFPTIPAGSAASIDADYYVGPKDFSLLSQMEQEQEDVMQLGWFLFFSNLGLIAITAKALLSLMGLIQGFVINWGVTIILTTLVIRLLLWPLTAKAARASKRMQKLQKPMQEIREKYKDNPQKLNEEMMKMWKSHKINPLAGCWPVLIQFPIFIAFFNMLRSSADLRFAGFLWIQDLSMPDATIRFGEAALPFIGNSLNVLPFLWLVTMYFQMKMMPQPSVDNAQVKIIKWMPFIFFPFTYFFSSGLVLYWTTTNCFSILQQYLTNRTPDEEDVHIEQELAEAEQKKKGGISKGPLVKKKKKKKDDPNSPLARRR